MYRSSLLPPLTSGEMTGSIQTGKRKAAHCPPRRKMSNIANHTTNNASGDMSALRAPPISGISTDIAQRSVSLFSCIATVTTIAIYGPMIYKALYIMLLMRANPLRGQEGGGGVGPWKSRLVLGIEPSGECHFTSQKHNVQGRINQRSIGIYVRELPRVTLTSYKAVS
jgi:hypothetical protein